MIAIIDYGAGNIKSLQFALNKLGMDSCLTTDKKVIKKSKAMILPGVGAFSDAMFELNNLGLTQVIKEEIRSGKPLLGICLGMQLLYESSNEGKVTEGLGLLRGSIKRIEDIVKVPHMGWNTLSFHQPSEITNELSDSPYVYFVHSYFATDMNEHDLVGSVDYGGRIPVIVQKENIIGMQFHPEKSGDVGLLLLKNFREMIG